jgi:hypothetical protein
MNPMKISDEGIKKEIFSMEIKGGILADQMGLGIKNKNKKKNNNNYIILKLFHLFLSVPVLFSSFESIFFISLFRKVNNND